MSIRTFKAKGLTFIANSLSNWKSRGRKGAFMSDIRSIDAEHIRIATEFAGQYGVVGDIHSQDYIYWFEHQIQSEGLKHLAPLHYMQGGRATAHIIRDLTHQWAPSKPNFDLLDFAAGYGRVSRFIKEVLPDVNVTGCDIHEEAIDFLRSTIGVDAFLSSTIPEQFDPPKKFDMIFCLSFFTHMPKRTFTRWLQALAEVLNPGGLLIFTTHGRTIRKDMGTPPLDETGFWFLNESEQKDLNTSDYGNNVTTFDFVCKQIAATNLAVEGFKGPGIGHHDLFILRAPI